MKLGSRFGVALIVAGGISLALPLAIRGHALGSLAFGTPTKLSNADGNTEPRATVTPDGKHWVVANRGGTAVVYGSNDGLTGWTQTASNPADQSLPTIDVDIVSTRTGRLIATELDTAGLNFRTSFSDDGGAHWTAVTFAAGFPAPDSGTGIGDTDRPWLAVGPDDPTSHLPTVYLLFHNLASGTVSHNMYVTTSTDNGTNFGLPVPVTAPGSQAFTDLQCSDSGGPSNIFVNQQDGRVYAVFGTRSSIAGGGCGASITGTFEVNVVAATRVWVATAPASSAALATGWTNSLAVDDNATGQIVGMQLAPGAIDSGGNVYVLYPESPNGYPNYDGAAIKYVHATQAGIVAMPFGVLPPATDPWSSGVTVAPAGGAGHVLPHIVAGNTGQLDMAYFTGDAIPGATPPTKANWFITAAQTLDALDANPVITEVRVSNTPTYQTETASTLMGACGSGPTAGVENGLSAAAPRTSGGSRWTTRARRSSPGRAATSAAAAAPSSTGPTSPRRTAVL